MGLFGGSKQKQESYNVNNQLLTDKLGSTVDLAGVGGSALRDILIGGDASGFNQYKANTGFDFAADQGAKGILGNKAAGGLLRSGSAGKALVNFGNNLQQQYLDNYLQRLTGMSQLGLGAGGVLAGTGNVSKGSSSSKNGLGGLLGGGASLIAASSRKVKTNIKQIGKLEDGLPVYTFNYVWGGPTRTGVMADEVAQYQPQALGPIVDGIQTVNYGMLEGWNGTK